MNRNGDAHENLSLFFQIGGVPPKMVMDGSKEQNHGSFMKKCQEADFHINQTEQYSTWQLQAEGTIIYLKKAVVRKMVREGAPNRIWEDALEFEAYVRSNKALDIYMLKGKVPETVMFGGIYDISQFCRAWFYDWVVFRDKPIKYSDENSLLGMYLGPAIYVGQEMMDKIMKAIVEVFHRSTYRGIKED